jgi:hypothetical protein
VSATATLFANLQLPGLTPASLPDSPTRRCQRCARVNTAKMAPPAHPQARFDPIPPDLDLYGLVDATPNFKWVQRVSRLQIRNLGQQEFEKVVLMHVVLGGKPLVVEGWDSLLSKQLFSADWLEKVHDKKRECFGPVAWRS